MARSWRMFSSALLLLGLVTHCIDDESETGGSGARGGSPGSGGRTSEGGSGGGASGLGGAPVAGSGIEAEGGSPDGGSTDPGGASNGGASPGGASNGGSGGVERVPECVLAGEAGAGMTCCWECPVGEPCRHLECGNGTVEEGCLVPFACYQASPAGGIGGPYHSEECDDGNRDDGDGCSSNCFIEYDLLCGNGQLDEHEDCDDGNRNPNDGCDARCHGRYWYHCDVPGEPCVEDVCGDGRSGHGLCDDGNTDSGDGCSADCEVELGWTCPPEGACEEAFCGNHSVDVYAADDEDGSGGAWNDGGQLIRREDCDDGNRVSGDGCSADCRTEEGWECDRGICLRPDCGDGYVFPPEACDDGNDQPGDGCDESCEIESGWFCWRTLSFAGISECARIACGDGFHFHDSEECDDGNRRSGDGCSSSCELEGERCTELEEQ